MKCKSKTEVYSRVCGYYRPVQQWNPGKADEYHQRRKFNLTLACENAGTAPAIRMAAAGGGEPA
jgi:ribonucleoside-triphosphate reductase